jgi:CubicO group peptidase (beta-lactamase class C family)
MLALVLIATFGLSGCTRDNAGKPPTSSVTTPDPSLAVTHFSYDDLMTGSASAPVNDAAFAMPTDAEPADRQFTGSLELVDVAGNGGFQVQKDLYNYSATEERRHLPPFRYRFVQDGNDLVPATQGLSITGSAYWNYIIGPGRIWKESGDRGAARGSFPFALVERNANCTHNGVMMFLFDGTKVSQVRYQITQETCPYFKFNMWGAIPATYTPEKIPGADAIRAAHAAETANRLPTKPLSALETDFPGSGVNPANFGKGVTASEMTTYGLFINGTNYVGGCTTRYGSYPYCDSMRLPSFSIAKSAFTGIALMRLGEKYGPSVQDQRIGDYVPETVGSAGKWANVTFNNTLDMATGNYYDAGYEIDEKQYLTNFNAAEGYGDKILAAVNIPTKQDPGKLWVYHTSDSFILTRAMNNYLVRQQGENADIFNLVRDEVYRPLHLSAGSQTTVRTGNSTDGTPLGGTGMFWIRDDMAKVAKFLNNQEGKIDGEQVLSGEMLAAAMQKNPADRGLKTTGTTAYDYNNGFWSKEWRQGDNPQFGCSFRTPFMWGYGGCFVVMMPNGSTYYYFSDNYEISWDDAVVESHRLIPHCP